MLVVTRLITGSNYYAAEQIDVAKSTNVLTDSCSATSCKAAPMEQNTVYRETPSTDCNVKIWSFQAMSKHSYTGKMVFKMS